MPFLIPEGVTLAEGLAATSAAAAVGGTALAYNASMQQAQQSKLNAQAQAQAISAEQQRQQLETQQAQQRTALNQERFRAQQYADLASNGTISTTGSALGIMADTYAASQRDLEDIGYQRDTNAWGMSAASNAAIAQGDSMSRAITAQAGGTLLSNASNVAYQGSKLYSGN
jgi:hypothetical protein